MMDQLSMMTGLTAPVAQKASIGKMGARDKNLDGIGNRLIMF
jgi:hypothetical protein